MPVHQPVYSTGYVTIHSQPEGALIYVMDRGAVGYASGHHPSQCADGMTAEWLYVWLMPTGPGQITQRGQIPTGQISGSSSTFFMYHTGPGAVTNN